MEYDNLQLIERGDEMRRREIDTDDDPEINQTDDDGSKFRKLHPKELFNLTPDALLNFLLAMVTKLRRNLTYSTAINVIELLNIKTKSQELKSSVYHLKKIVNQFSSCFEIHNICHECGTYLGKKSEEKLIRCIKCDTNVNLELNETSFMYLPLGGQLREIFETTEAHNNLGSKIQKKLCQYAIEDIYDGNLYRRTLNSSTDMISLNFSVDGAPIFEASTNSAYPVLCTINELNIRGRRHQVMLYSLWFGSGKPRSMNGYLTPFVSEAKKLHDEGFEYIFQGRKYIRKVKLLMGVCDSVARPLLRYSTQYNGQYGCGLCLHPGERIARGRGFARVYPSVRGNPFGEGLRTHNDTLIHAKKKIKGMKGVSILCDLPWYDIVHNLDADWMHCVALGVCRQFANLWFDSKNHGESFYFGTSIHEVDELLPSFSPTLEVSRSTRLMSDRKHWKAHEWVMFLLCYSLVILKTLFPMKYVSHWALLVDGISVLLKKSIMKSELEYARQCLTKFIEDVEYLYGKQHISFNVHLLAHLPESAKNWGPLWTHSAFIYEDFNQIMKSYVHSPKGVGIQIFDSFRLKYAIVKILNVCEDHLGEREKEYINKLLNRNQKINPKMLIGSVGVLGKITRIHQLSREKYLALRSIDVKIEEDSKLLEFNRCVVSGEIIYSRSYKLDHVNKPKRVNFNVILKNGQIFEVQSFLNIKSGRGGSSCIFGYYYEKERGTFVTGRKLQHLIPLRDKLETLSAVCIEDVDTKVIILEANDLRIAYIHPCGKELLT